MNNFTRLLCALPAAACLAAAMLGNGRDLTTREILQEHVAGVPTRQVGGLELQRTRQRNATLAQWLDGLGDCAIGIDAIGIDQRGDEDFGHDSTLLAGAVAAEALVRTIGVVAQRLVRRLCPACRRQYTPPPDTLRALNLTEAEAANIPFYRPVGCDACHHTGDEGESGGSPGR